eukprot:jgi/Picre1/33204/NNA_008529.t1
MIISQYRFSDSYKASHFVQYPDATKMVAYGEFRQGFDGDEKDTRMIWYGIRYIIEHYVERKWTREDVDKADVFYSGHMAPMHSSYPYPRDLFLKFIEENDGYMPVKVQALPEGMVIAPHVPVFQITAEGEYAPLLSVDEGRDSPLLASRLHDFGFRGCTCMEQSVLGGVSHLLNFDGTDTLSAAYYAQFALNAGKPVGMSIPATEHSVMTAWPTEREAIENMIQKFGTGLFATVMDSYNYQKALDTVVPAVSAQMIESGGYWVLRPDSGDPKDSVLAALRAAEKTFCVTVNNKGYKVTQGVGSSKEMVSALQSLQTSYAMRLQRVQRPKYCIWYGWRPVAKGQQRYIEYGCQALSHHLCRWKLCGCDEVPRQRYIKD